MTSGILRIYLLACIVVVTLAKLSLIGSGYHSITDEFRHIYGGEAVKLLLEGNVKKAIAQIYLAEGRPADVFVKIIPNIFQMATAKIFGFDNPHENSYPVFIFNFLLYVLFLFLHYKVSKLIFKDSLWALLSVLMYGVLINSYLYLRHALPYDLSLLILYYAFYFVAKNGSVEKITYIKAFVAGIIAFFGYMAYPGYFVLLFAIALFFSANAFLQHPIKKGLLLSVVFAFGCFCCLSAFELTARLAGTSYIVDAMNLSSTIKSGSFEESFTFILKYLTEVERISGLVMLLGLFLFIPASVVLFKTNRLREHSTVLLFFVILGSGFLLYAALGYFFHKMVFYGRLLHQYFPFFCLFSLFACSVLLDRMTKKAAPVLIFLSVVLVAGFVVNFLDYRSYTYPRDVAFQLKKTTALEKVGMACEYEINFSVSPYEYYATLPSHYSGNDSLLLVNCCIPFHIYKPEKYHSVKPPGGYQLISSVPHNLNCVAYQYEGYNPLERKNMQSVDFDIKVYARN